LVVTDLQMPTMGGDEMASVIKAEALGVQVSLSRTTVTSPEGRWSRVRLAPEITPDSRQSSGV
jgi:CheY-like chemotaxis protein